MGDDWPRLRYSYCDGAFEFWELHPCKVGALDMNVCPGFEGALTHGQRSYKIFYKSCFCEGQLEGTSQCKPSSSSPSQTLVLCIDRLEPWTRTQLVRYHVPYILDPELTQKK